ncbi:MAG TPA: SLBB domain-containing protein, partial [Candidatus Saccharimonadales bacterium]|nr:SLBB domain-containing protein [Candidatus Saccharimonadales bacterium]
GFTEMADLSRAIIERRTDAAARDTAFLRLSQGRQELLNEDDRQYVKLRARERDAVSADLSRVLASAGAGPDIALLDGDRIVIPRRFPSISVQGEVRSPGLVAFQDGRRLDDYVKAAGGYTDRADKGSTRVTIARTGQQMKPKDAGAIRAGDTVWVPAKPKRSGWATLRDVLTTAAQVATVYLVIQQATK